MNLLLVTEKDRSLDGNYKITHAKFKHLKNVLKVELGKKILARELNGLMGYSSIIKIAEDHIILEPSFERKPAPPLSIKLIIALPRPKMLRRIFRSCSIA